MPRAASSAAALGIAAQTAAAAVYDLTKCVRILSRCLCYAYVQDSLLSVSLLSPRASERPSVLVHTTGFSDSNHRALITHTN